MGTELVISPQAELQQAMQQAAFMPVMQVAQAIQRYNAVLQFTKEIMRDGKDYGSIPGTDKPTLLKPGAEKLCSFFGLSQRFLIVKETEVWEGDEPFFYYWYKCQLSRGEIVIGEGDGSCSSRESKYRYRWVGAEAVPSSINKDRLQKRGGKTTEMTFAVDKGETTGKYGKPEAYWQAFRDGIANGTARKTKKKIASGQEKDAWEIESVVYRVPNPDICDQVNTIQKMAQKRALIAATLIACNASEYYTQDVEDMDIIDVPYTSETRDQVAERRIAEERAKLEEQHAAAPKPTAGQLKFIQECQRGKKMISETAYYRILGNHGIEHSNEVRDSAVMKKILVDIGDAYKWQQEQGLSVSPADVADDVPAETYADR